MNVDRHLAADAQALERRLSDLVNTAYGLTSDEIALMWQTAPLLHFASGVTRRPRIATRLAGAVGISPKEVGK